MLSAEQIRQLLPRDRYVHPLLDPEVEAQMRQLAWPESFIVGRQAMSDHLQVLEQTVRLWLQPCLDLKDFPYFYISSGITDALNLWVAQEERAIQMFEGEYPWVKMLRPDLQVVQNTQDLRPDRVLYISQPASRDGNYLANWSAIVDTQVPIVLDAAYVGTTAPQPIVLKANVEQVFWGLSKTFGLFGARLGFVFAKKKQKLLERLNRAAYFNHHVFALTERLLTHFSIGWLHHKWQAEQKRIAQTLGVNASDCVLLAHTDNPEYAYFARGPGVNRLCFSPIFDNTKDLL